MQKLHRNVLDCGESSVRVVYEFIVKLHLRNGVWSTIVCLNSNPSFAADATTIRLWQDYETNAGSPIGESS